MKIAGIDYSMGSPSACTHPLDRSWNPKLCEFVFYSSLKKYEKQNVFEKVFHIKKPYHTTDKNFRIQRYTHTGQQMFSFLTQQNVSVAYIEGYSFNSRSNQMMQIGENGGIMRAYLSDSEINMYEVPPTRVKKFATKNGRSDKLAMVDQFIEEIELDMYKIFNRVTASSPIDDIADAYFVCKYAHNEQYGEQNEKRRT